MASIKSLSFVINTEEYSNNRTDTSSRCIIPDGTKLLRDSGLDCGSSLFVSFPSTTRSIYQWTLLRQILLRWYYYVCDWERRVKWNDVQFFGLSLRSSSIINIWRWTFFLPIPNICHHVFGPGTDLTSIWPRTYRILWWPTFISVSEIIRPTQMIPVTTRVKYLVGILWAYSAEISFSNDLVPFRLYAKCCDRTFLLCEV